MNILFSSISGNSKTESQHYVRVLERLGHRVFRFTTPAQQVGLSPESYAESGYELTTHIDSIVKKANFKPDLLLYLDPNGLIPLGMESVSFPAVCVLCDTHRNLRARLNIAKFFDHVFLYHRNYIKFFKAQGIKNVHWLPYACDLDIFYPLNVDRTFDVAFVGNLFSEHHPRHKIIKRIAEHWNMNEQRYYLQSEIPDIYSRAKIVINLPLGDDLNFRFFEAMSCKAMLLTSRVSNGQEILFKEGVHYAAFGSEKELFDKIDYYLTHDSRRDAISQAGYAEVSARHGLQTRLKGLLNAVQDNPKLDAPIRQMKRSEIDRQYAWFYGYWRSVDACLYLVKEAKRTGRPWMTLVFLAAISFLRKILR